MTRINLAVVLAATGLLACKPDKPAGPENPVKWNLEPPAAALAAGGVKTVKVTAEIDPGWYVYAITQKSGGPTPMTIAVAPTPPFSIQGNPVGPQPVVIFDKEFGIETERYEGNPTFAIPVALPAAPVPQSQNLEVKVRYQACNANFCLPARTTVLTTPVKVAGG
jgi:hypothetical protein